MLHLVKDECLTTVVKRTTRTRETWSHKSKNNKALANISFMRRVQLGFEFSVSTSFGE